MKPIRLAILNLTAGGISGGYKLYLQKLLPLLAADRRISEVLCAAPSGMKIQEWLPIHQKIKLIYCQPYRFLLHRNDRELAKQLSGFSPDIIYLPVLRYFSFDNVPVVTMIQNMAPFTVWSYYNFKEKLKLAVQYLDSYSSLSKSAKTIAISEFVQATLITKLRVPISKTCLIHFGAEPLPLGSKPLNIPASFFNPFFTAGSIEPYRGLEDIILALSELSRKTQLNEYLIVAGPVRPEMEWYLRKLKHLAAENGVKDRIFWAGQMTQKEMAWLYTHCKAFIMTSRVESFPMIALEVAVSGCHCISTDNPPLPEIFGYAALYYPPGDSHALAGRIIEFSARESAANESVNEGMRGRAAHFSWDECSKLTVDCFLQTLSLSQKQQANTEPLP